MLAWLPLQSPSRPKDKPRTTHVEADDAVRQRPISNANRHAGRDCRRACRAGRPSSTSGSPATRPRSAAAGRARPDQRPRPGRSRPQRQPTQPHPSTDARGPSCSQAASAACLLPLSSHDPYAAAPWTDHLAASTARDDTERHLHHRPRARTIANRTPALARRLTTNMRSRARARMCDGDAWACAREVVSCCGSRVAVAAPRQ